VDDGMRKFFEKKSQVGTSNETAPAFIDDAAKKTGQGRSTVEIKTARTL